MTTTTPLHDAAALLHSALELSTHQLALCSKPADAANHRIIREHRALLALTAPVVDEPMVTYSTKRHE